MENTFKGAAEILSKNIDFITEECTMWMEEQYPNQKGKSKKELGYSKCSRDLNFILNALVADLNEDSDEHTVRIANTYWLLDKKQIFNIDIELAVHEKMRDIIISYIFKNKEYIKLNTILLFMNKLYITITLVN